MSTRESVQDVIRQMLDARGYDFVRAHVVEYGEAAIEVRLSLDVHAVVALDERAVAITGREPARLIGRLMQDIESAVHAMRVDVCPHGRRA